MNARRIAAAVLAAALLRAPFASAEEPIRIGLIAEFSGPFAGYGKQIHGGIKAYLQQHGDSCGGRKIAIVPRDTHRPRSRGRQAARAGPRHAGQGRFPRGLRPHPPSGPHRWRCCASPTAPLVPR